MESVIDKSVVTAEERPASRRIRLWLDSNYIIKLLEESTHSPEKQHHERRIIKLIDQFKVLDYTPEIAITQTVLEEVTGIPDPQLLQAGITDHTFMQEGHYRSNFLNKTLPKAQAFIDLLTRLGEHIQGTCQVMSLAAEDKPIQFVYSKRCLKESEHTATILQDYGKNLMLEDVKRHEEMMKKHPSWHVSPQQQAVISTYRKARDIESFLTEKQGHDALGVLFNLNQPDEHVRHRADPLYADPLFQLMAHEWLDRSYPLRKNRGEFSIQSGIKRSDAELQLILTNDGIERTEGYGHWQHAVSGKAIAAAHIAHIPLILEAMGTGDLSTISLTARKDLLRFCQAAIGMPQRPLSIPSSTWAEEVQSTPPTVNTAITI